MDSLQLVATFLAAIGSGLIAGFFLAFSATVMAALGRVQPSAGVAAMQAINVVVLNPVFLGTFFGTALLCLALSIAAVTNWWEPGAVYVLAGSLLYLVGSILVTIVFNVPLNDALAAVRPDSAEATALWERYRSEWTRWNHVRTAASLAAMAAFVAATAEQWGQS